MPITPFLHLEPYNLRFLDRPSRCITGARVPVGLAGFCWETPLCADALAQQSPLLSGALEVLDGLGRHGSDPAELQRLSRLWAEILDARLERLHAAPRALALPWQTPVRAAEGRPVECRNGDCPEEPPHGR